MKRINVNRLRLLMGTSKPAAVMTLLNLGLYGGWIIAYITCTILRSIYFAKAETQLIAQGAVQYTITVESPAFAVLKVLLYLLPVFVIAWAAVIKVEDKRNVLCDKKLIIAALAVVVVAAFTAFVDMSRVGMIF